MSGLEELLHALGARKGGEESIYLLFCGDISKDTGESWCPDCVNGIKQVEYIFSDSGSYAMNMIFVLHNVYVNNGICNPRIICNSRERLTRPFWTFLYTNRIRKDRRFRI